MISPAGPTNQRYRAQAPPQVVRRDMRLLTLPEVHRVASNIMPRNSAMVLAASYAGMRWGELAGLQVANIDLLRGSITVSSTLAEVRGDCG